MAAGDDMRRIIPYMPGWGFCVTRPVPLHDEHGAQVRVVKPGVRGVLIREYDGSYPGSDTRLRAVVDFGDGVEYDVSRDSIWVDE